MTEPDVVYGKDPFGSGWLFLLHYNATANAAICNAYSKARTWGEFRALAGEGEYEAVIDRFFTDAPALTFEEFASRVRAAEPGVSEDKSRERFDDALSNGERLPLPEEPFDMPDDDGAWIYRHMESMCAWVPDDIQERFGKLSGSWNYVGDWDLQGDEVEIVTAFEEEGYECRLDQDLVNRAFSW